MSGWVIGYALVGLVVAVLARRERLCYSRSLTIAAVWPLFAIGLVMLLWVDEIGKETKD